MPRPPRRRRSCHAVPATSARMIAKAADLDADVVFLDLEDSVAPDSRGEPARAAAVAALTSTTFAAPTTAIRINALGSPWWRDDLAAVIAAARARVAVVIVPKVERPEDVAAIDDALSRLESTFDLPPRSVGVDVQIESALGLVNVERIAACGVERVEALVFGPGDFAASLGMPTTTIGGVVPGAVGDAFHYALARIVTAARAFGLHAIDGPYSRLHDDAGVRASAERSRALGFDGKWSIHPEQIPILNDVFSPGEVEVARAHELIASARNANAAGAGAATVGAEMIDEATRRMAEGVVARAGVETTKGTRA